MTTRFYLRDTQGAGNRPVPITPDVDSAWEATISTGLERIRILPGAAKSNQAFTTSIHSDTDNTNQDVVYKQYIAPLTAGETITGAQALKFQIRAQETANNNNLFTSCGIRVIAADGVTVRKTVIAVTRDGTEMSSTTLLNRQWAETSVAGDYTILQGDFLVIEVGVGGDPSGPNSHSSSLRFGDNSGSDLPEDNTSTDDFNPWVELTDTLTIADWLGMPTLTLSAEQLFDESTLFDSTDSFTTTVTGFGQSFRGHGGRITKATFLIRRSNSPTGNIVAKVYAHSGTFGIVGIPTGPALATSSPIDVSTLSTSDTDVEFTFSSGPHLTQGTAYFVTIEYSGASGTDTVVTNHHGSSSIHSGNKARLVSGSWTGVEDDLAFKVYDVSVEAFAPTLAYQVELPVLSSTVQLFAPTVATAAGDQEVTLPTIGSTAVVNVSTLAYEVNLPVIASTVALNAPALAYQIDLVTITSTQLFAPSLTFDQFVTLSTIASTVQTFSPTLAYVLEMPIILAGSEQSVDTNTAGTAPGLLDANPFTAAGQSFTGQQGFLSKATFNLRKFGSPTGNIVARLYAHSGTFGSSSVPTGSPLATSDPVLASSLTTSFADVEFGFNEYYVMTADTKYVIVVEYNDGDVSNHVRFQGSSSSVHPGNFSLYDGSWAVGGAGDLRFSTLAIRSTMFAPSLAYEINLPIIGSTTALFAPTLAYEVNLPVIVSTVELSAPTLAYEVNLSTISDTVVNVPALAYQVDLSTIPSTVAIFALSLAYEVNLPTIASTVVVNAPTLAYEVNLPVIASTAQLFPPTVALAAGDQEVVLPTIASTAQTFSPTISYEVNLPAIGSTVVTNVPTLAYQIDLPTIPSTLLVNAPTLAYVVSLPTIVSTLLVNQPTLAYQIDLSTITSTIVVNTPSLSYEINLPTIASTATLFAPTVVEQGALALPHIASTVTTNAPTLAYVVTLPTIGVGSITFAPTLAYQVDLPTISSTVTVTQPSLAYQMTVPFVTSTVTVNSPALAYEVNLSSIGSTVVLNAPTVTLQSGLELPFLASTSSLNAPTLSYAQDLQMAFISAENQMFPMEVFRQSSVAGTPRFNFVAQPRKVDFDAPNRRSLFIVPPKADLL